MEKLCLDTTVLQHQPCPSPWPRRPQSRPLGPDRPPGLSLLLSACLAAPQGVCGVHVLYAVCTRVCGLHVCICCVRCTRVCTRGMHVCVRCVHVCMVLGEPYPHALTAGSLVPRGPPQPGLRLKGGPVTFHLRCSQLFSQCLGPPVAPENRSPGPLGPRGCPAPLPHAESRRPSESGRTVPAAGPQRGGQSALAWTVGLGPAGQEPPRAEGRP